MCCAHHTRCSKVPEGDLGPWALCNVRILFIFNWCVHLQPESRMQGNLRMVKIFRNLFSNDPESTQHDLWTHFSLFAAQALCAGKIRQENNTKYVKPEERQKN